MKVPSRLQPLVDDGLVDEVVRQLKGGKEADVYVVRCGAQLRCAKVYKAAHNRSFRTHAQYREGRKVRGSRHARAMDKGSRFGRAEAEAAWQNAEVDALFRLAAAGVRVPTPHAFVDGILLMELVTDAQGEAAPRLDDVELSAAEAVDLHAKLIAQVVRMLCNGLIHGDLSEYNVLLDAHGPVIIDLPQAVDAAGNNHAPRMFARDVDNLAAYLGRYAPALNGTDYAKEIWALYQGGALTTDTVLTGRYVADETAPDVEGVLREIDAAREEAALMAG
jgi:RIO kinase 1